MNRHGWLARNDTAPAILAGVSFDASCPTRREEYGLLHDTVQPLAPGTAYDAGTGYNPEIHVAPYIVAQLGWWVEAGDMDLRQFAMCWHPRVRRSMVMIGAAPFPDNAFGLIYSISTLEHVSEEARGFFAIEAARLAKDGATLVVTADEVEPEELASWFAADFDVGELAPEPEQMLEPRVAYVVATRKPRL